MTIINPGERHFAVKKNMKLELTKEETELLSECVTSTVNKTLSSLNNEYSDDKNRFDVGYEERYILENLVAKGSLLLKITEEVKA